MITELNSRIFMSNKKIRFKNKIILKTDNTYEILYSPFLLRTINSKDSDKLKESIKNFLTVLSRDCINFNPNIFIQNFKKTRFNLLYLNKNYSGSSVHFHFVNRLYINVFNDINHELLHLSSTKDNNALKAFDEGYTQLL